MLQQIQVSSSINAELRWEDINGTHSLHRFWNPKYSYFYIFLLLSCILFKLKELSTLFMITVDFLKGKLFRFQVKVFKNLILSIVSNDVSKNLYLKRLIYLNLKTFIQESIVYRNEIFMQYPTPKDLAFSTESKSIFKCKQHYLGSS